jgi:hypothetical protein
LSSWNRQAFHPGQLISSKENASNNESGYTIGRVIELLLDRICMLA